MTLLRATTLLFVLWAGVVSACIDPEHGDPAARSLRGFLDAHGHQSGLPDAARDAAFAPHLSADLAAAIVAARAEQARFVARFPDEKPPWVEGPIFNSSAYEPYTSYIIVPGADGDDTRRTLRVDYSDDTVVPALRWTDHYVLVHERGDWRLDDVLYRRDGNADGIRSLRGALAERFD